MSQGIADHVAEGLDPRKISGSYPVLRAVAWSIKVLSLLGGTIGLLYAFATASNAWGMLSLFIFLGILLMTLLSVLLQWAAAELILLFVDSADNVRAMREHMLNETARSSQMHLADVASGPQTPDTPPMG